MRAYELFEEDSKKEKPAMRAYEVFKNYRQVINPPYKVADLPAIFGTILILIAIPLTVLLVFQSRDPRSRAEATRGEAGDLWADVILGKRDFSEIGEGEIMANNVNKTGGVIIDRNVVSGQLGIAYVWDANRSRIMVVNLNSCTGTTVCSASKVIGQPSANDYGACNRNSALDDYPNRAPASASTLCG